MLADVNTDRTHEERRRRRDAVAVDAVPGLYARLPTLVAINLFVAAVFAAMFAPRVGVLALSGWLAFMAAVQALRLLSWRQYRRAPPASRRAPRWLRAFLVGTAATGAAWGLAGVLFHVPGAVAHQVFLAFTIGGMVAGAAISLTVHLPAFFAFYLPALLPYAARLALEFDPPHLGMAALVLAFGTGIGVLGVSIHRSLRASEETLRRARDELERRVEEQTAEWRAANRALLAEIAERQRVEAALRQSEQRFRDFAAAASDWFWETDAKHRFVWFSPNVEDLVGVPRAWHYGKTRLEMMAPGADPALIEEHRRALDAREPFRDFEYLRRGPRGDTWLSVSGVPVFDAEGRFQGYRGVSRDITEKRRAEEQRELLLAELAHRVNNTLAVIQAFAEQTAARAATVPAFLDTFRGRLLALAAAHNLLTRSGWQGVSLAGLARAALLPHLGPEDRVRIAVEDLPLKPAVAVTLALALHELATNAVKHGALSVPGGRVALTGRPVGGGSGEELRVEWQETGGPPVQRPERSGFGTRMIVQAAEYQHQGRVELDWREEGLVCRLCLPLAEAAAPLEQAASSTG